ncbi:MAG: cobalamin-dependent protein [Desulfovibrionaceae bacterium]|nr:cobalamin-dependent protein [Desulfovibrionaceae bacterium]
MPTPEELLKTMHDSVVNFEDEKAAEAAKQWIADGQDPVRGIMDGLVAGMNTVGQLFKNQEYFVPEVLLSADTMNAGLDVLNPHIKDEASDNAGTIVLGTIQGDIHDLGKNLVALMLKVGGFTVHDLGVNVEHDQFIEAIEKYKPDVVGISAMMTTTMMGMKQLIPKIREAQPNVGILIGGAPVTAQIVTLFQADGFTTSAVDVTAEAKRVMAARA